jgi:hypothetical protein
VCARVRMRTLYRLFHGCLVRVASLSPSDASVVDDPELVGGTFVMISARASYSSSGSKEKSTSNKECQRMLAHGSRLCTPRLAPLFDDASD